MDYQCLDEELPHPWTAVLDPSTNEKYYWNEETDEVSWDPPAGTKTSSGPKKLPAGWEAVIDEGSGDTYYWNVDTDEVTWDFPAGAAESAPAPAPAPAPAGSGGKSDAAAGAGTKGGKRKPRGVIMAESYNVDTEAFELKTYPKSQASEKAIRAVLEKESFLFASLSPDDLSQVVAAMSERQVRDGEELIKQGDNGDYFYIVETGNFDIFVNGKKVASRGPGSSFGEKALLYNCPRAATVMAVGGSALVWALDRKTFRHMLASTQEEKLNHVIQSLRKVTLLDSLTEAQMNKVAEAVQTMAFQPGDRIIQKGEEGDKFYMIDKGSVICTELAGDDVTLPAGAFFGERALLTSEPRAATVSAVEPTTCFMLDRKTFNEVLGPLKEIMDQNVIANVLSSIPVIKEADLTASQKQAIAAEFDVRTYGEGDDMMVAGVPCDSLFILKQGTARVSDGRNEQRLPQGAYFGDHCLLESTSQSMTATASEGAVEVFVLQRARFEAVVGKLQDLLARAKTGATPAAAEKAATDAASGRRGGGSSSAGGGRGVSTKGHNPKNIRYDDLEPIVVLGAGTFGKVKLVRHKPTNAAYALKILRKAQIVACKQQTNVMNEKNIMAMIDHPFILKLEATFKDPARLYMLLELVQGGELFSLLANQDNGCVPSSQAQFYAACVVSALERLHADNILYRDLKPENMLLDAEGYIKVVDMGFAKIVKDRTYTLCGTPEYLAPELVMGKGHHKGVDYWATGILIYEMLCGFSPFADFENGDQMVIVENILRGKLEFPRFMTDKAAKHLIQRLLERNPMQRYGCRRAGAKDIKKHMWFKAMNWDALVAKKLKAPWVPPLKDPFDTTHFDYEEEPEEDFGEYVDDGSGWDMEF